MIIYISESKIACKQEKSRLRLWPGSEGSYRTVQYGMTPHYPFPRFFLSFFTLSTDRERTAIDVNLRLKKYIKIHRCIQKYSKYCVCILSINKNHKISSDNTCMYKIK